MVTGCYLRVILHNYLSLCYLSQLSFTGPHSAVSNVPDCRSRGPQFDPARSHTFMMIDHEMISTAILLPSADSRMVVVSYKRKYVHEVLVNCLVKLAQEKVWLGELIVPT